MTGIMTELVLRECMEKAQADYDSSLAKPKININARIKLSKEHLKELRNNAYSGSEEKDVIDHIAKVLEILDSIKIPNVDTDRLRVHVFPLSLTGAARKCKNNMISNDEGDGPDYFEFVTWMNLKFKDHRRMDGMTKSATWHSLVKGGVNNKLMDDIVSRDEEWKESDYVNPPNTDTDSFFKPYLDAQEKCDICLVEKEHHLKNHSSDVSVQNSASGFDDKKNDLINEKERISKKKTKNEAKSTKPDMEWKRL
ncbi:hypothetical protein Tco_0789923 [Tanacetum coccineum]